MNDLAERLDLARDRLKDAAPTPGYLTVEEAAELARCAPITIRRAIDQGRLHAFRPSHRLLIRETDVRDWVEKRPAREEAPPRRESAGRSPHRRPAPGSVTALRELERKAER